MKRYYEHRYNKVSDPFVVQLYEIGDYLSEEDYENVSNFIDKIGFTVTVEDETNDKETGYIGGFRLDDWDMQPIPDSLVLFRDVLSKAVEDYVWDNEERILEDEKVNRAFDWFYAEREHIMS